MQGLVDGLLPGMERFGSLPLENIQKDVVCRGYRWLFENFSPVSTHIAYRDHTMVFAPVFNWAQNKSIPARSFRGYGGFVGDGTAGSR